MYVTRDLSKPDPLRVMRAAAKKPATTVKLSGAKLKTNPVRVVKLRGGDPVNKAADLALIRKYDRAGFNEHNSAIVAKLKADFFRRYGDRV